MRNYIRYFKLFFIYSFINHVEKLILDLYRILIYESFAFPLKFLHIPALEIATLIRITNRFSSAHPIRIALDIHIITSDSPCVVFLTDQ